VHITTTVTSFNFCFCFTGLFFCVHFSALTLLVQLGCASGRASGL